MRMIDVALPKFDDPTPAPTTSNDTLSIPKFTARRSSAFVQSRAAAQNEEEYHVVQDEEDEEQEDPSGKKDEFFEVEERDVVSLLLVCISCVYTTLTLVLPL